MVRVKATKTELKTQRDGLRRYQRYLPTLQLKKQQLQAEIRQVEVRLAELVAREAQLEADAASWVALFADEVDFTTWLRVDRLVTDAGNVAGLTVPVLREVRFAREQPDLRATPTWYDDALALLEELLAVRLARRVLDEQRRLLADELRTTNQRVNLFERVKIPECRDAIRRIRIALGDVQTLEVARGKIAKVKSLERGTAS
jgi:V/A-type H+-transporting ATPase subunit D